MKWAADWWGIEIIAEDDLDKIILECFMRYVEKEAEVSYGHYEDNKIEVGTASSILEEEGKKYKYPMVLTFHRGD